MTVAIALFALSVPFGILVGRYLRALDAMLRVADDRADDDADRHEFEQFQHSQVR